MPSAELLLQDAAWLKRLAIMLANDKDEADDLVQESWIAAWRRKPDASRADEAVAHKGGPRPCGHEASR